jgi:FG-GAP repeat
MRLVGGALGLVLLTAAGCGDPPCPGPRAGGMCRQVRIDGLDAHGELGFRFGEPLDLDGDGVEDLVGGQRRAGEQDTGLAAAWTRDGALLRQWSGVDVDGLFGHGVMPVPDLDGDGLADVVVSAPNAIVDGETRGLVEAYALDGRRLWRSVGRAYDGFGWQLARAGDHDGDGIEELWAGAPSNTATAHVYLLSGATGAVVMTVTSPRADDQFGWYLAPLDDLDRDGVADLAIGAPTALVDGARRGAVTLVSGATGATLRELTGQLAAGEFGIMLAPVDDLDGDGTGEVAVGAPGGLAPETPGKGEVQIFSGATGVRLRLLTGSEDGELYGRMVARVDDLDGDGLRDLAIGAPWWHGRDGRFELRSARTFALLASVRGAEAGWLGWHLTRADRGVVASQLHLDADRGALELYRLP